MAGELVTPDQTSFKYFTAEQFNPSPRTQKIKCRALQDLSIGIKQVNIDTKINRVFIFWKGELRMRILK